MKLNCTYTFLYLQNGVVSLIDCTLMEDPEGTDDEGECLVHFILTLLEMYNNWIGTTFRLLGIFRMNLSNSSAEIRV